MAQDWRTIGRPNRPVIILGMVLPAVMLWVDGYVAISNATPLLTTLFQVHVTRLRGALKPQFLLA